MPDLFVGGPDEHGVVRYARELARGVIEAYTALEGHAESPPRLWESWGQGRPGHPLHLHFTDRLFGESPEHAATAFERIASLAPVSVTLHDVPQPSDGAANLPRRRECYRRVLAVSRGAVCNSGHEVALLRESGLLVAGPAPTVIPLPAHGPQRTVAGTAVTGIATVGADDLDSVAALVGFVYPGKGHREVIDSVARVAGGLDVIAFGMASTGHEADVIALAAHADSLGISFGTTGYISNEDLHRRCTRAAVPIAAHQHMSASASILAWLAAGRLPLVADSRYAREMLALRPGTMTLYSPNEMDGAIAIALAHPESTMLAPNVSTAPHLPDTVRSYIHFWEGVAW